METIQEENIINKSDEVLKKYFLENKTTLCILTHCPNGVCSTNYTISMMYTSEIMRKMNITLHVEYLANDVVTSRAKNNLIAKAIANRKITHMLFIDCHVSWNPGDIIKMIISEKDFIGGACPTGNYEWSVLTENPNEKNIIKELLKRRDQSKLKSVSNELMLTSMLSNYDINIENRHIEVHNNLCKVDSISSKFLMIRRPVILRLMNHLHNKKYNDATSFLKNNELNFLYGFFETEIKNNIFYKEDRVFCERWKELGGNIYLDISISLQIQKPEEFCGSVMLTML